MRSVVTSESAETIPLTMVGEVKQLEEDKPKVPKDTAPAVEISYYNNTIFPELLTDTVEVGEIIYTKVVFSENVPIIIADDKSARPSISYSIRTKNIVQD